MISSAAPLLSPQWFRVATLRPKLDAQARTERISYRRRIWHVLVRADGTRSFRLNAAAYAFAARCDGKLSMQRLWDLLLAEFKDDAPTQDELLQLLARLHEAGLLGFDRRPDFGLRASGATAGSEASPEAAPPRKNSLLSLRIPLGRPDAWLTAQAPRLAWLFNRHALALWALLVLGGAVAAALNLSMLAAYAGAWLATPRLMLLTWLAYPIVKALHELAHAFTLKQFGGKVNDWGLTLMMFTPVPYVDASAASALPRPRQRLLVSAAGIMLELGLASAALLLALNLETGGPRDFALAVFFIGSVSTVLVNGNPLLRFDGYHMLGDALELPNLASRSARHWLAWLRRRVLTVDGTAPPDPAPGEAPWLWVYAPAALACRLTISLALVAWLAGISFLLGAAVALYLAWTLAGQPLRHLLRWIQGSALAEAPRRLAQRRLALGAAAALGAFTLLPLPDASVAEGVVWLPEDAQVRAGTDGFIARVHVADGAEVRAGDLLFTLQAPALATELARLDGSITALDTERFVALRSDPARAVGIEHELVAARAELARTLERKRQLDVRAASAGRVAIAHADDLPGRFVKQGAVLAEVLAEAPTLVRVALPQEQATLVQGGTRGVAVRLAETGAQTWHAELQRDVAGAVTQLPSAALGERSGGRLVTDPADKSGLTSAQPVVVVDVLVDMLLGEHVAQRVGGRAAVRFDHGWAPLAWQAARRVQQWVLAHFNPAE